MHKWVILGIVLFYFLFIHKIILNSSSSFVNNMAELPRENRVIDFFLPVSSSEYLSVTPGLRETVIHLNIEVLT